MSFTVNDWDNEYARLARVASQHRTQGHVTSDSDHRALMSGLSRLGQNLEQLHLPPTEKQRRRRLISHLQQNPRFAQQEEMIDGLAMGVERLKQQSHLIGDEAKLHLNLLGDMEDQVDIAHAGLSNETNRANQLRADKSIWRLQMTVVGLSVLLIILILTGLT
mmetsp:Transcript_13257/g.15200  ORF Transcript_13257/g.15200 Transcript_13257/m.15200 type:complete len:163 (+) Transcript_13257:69-557(+)|eukprot:CAMPEP_0194132826 /NCGR_PEP_ID=MMETSP0152-20130528/3203_1 /TAXON_ID=1049557 /ORGANISM="Thalassiothrix antarctica, Strain L6-D1" /LENGTH=162 /DNA_ID=CAMNT_0038828001 /DNA_START=71 /DNA_END=559 /DNA_ORIENTATION=-